MNNLIGHVKYYESGSFYGVILKKEGKFLFNSVIVMDVLIQYISHHNIKISLFPDCLDLYYNCELHFSGGSTKYLSYRVINPKGAKPYRLL